MAEIIEDIIDTVYDSSEEQKDLDAPCPELKHFFVYLRVNQKEKEEFCPIARTGQLTKKTLKHLKSCIKLYDVYSLMNTSCKISYLCEKVPSFFLEFQDQGFVDYLWEFRKKWDLDVFLNTETNLYICATGLLFFCFVLTVF